MAKRNNKMDHPEDALAMLKADCQRVRDLFVEDLIDEMQELKEQILVS